MTPLHCAAMFDHPELVEYLLDQGADINALGKDRTLMKRWRKKIGFQSLAYENSV